MPLSWNEIRSRAVTFSRNWCAATREKAEAQTFWNEFFAVFGVRRRMVDSFEEPVKNLKGDTQFIDLFWKGRLIAEHKSRGKDLAKAHTQAMGYVQHLINEDRTEEAPRYILVSDFARIALHDLEPEDSDRESVSFPLADFPAHVRDFAFIAGYETRRLDPEDPANVRAVELLGNLHDRLEDAGYGNHDLQRFMVRILFCLFADDTGIFEPDIFKLFIQNRTREDGSDLGPQLARFFGVLNTPPDRRQATLDEDLAALPYVNGELYAEALAFPEFDRAMRVALQSCCAFRWERISPAIFGSLFQAVMLPRQRRQIGAHYTSERDILKLIRSLFLDDLRAEFEAIKHDKKKLGDFHRKLARLKFLDPACGCGNFLVITYRELRRLEMDVLQARFGKDLTEGDIRAECRLDVSQLFGIEIEEWPVRIAEVALWLMDHQLNQELFDRFSQIRPSVPLAKSPHIHHANALRLDWNDVLPAEECAYVLGNPPFVGKKARNRDQTADMELVLGELRGARALDYVCCWYLQAARYLVGNERIKVAFVSTNSITQGEQPGALWPLLAPHGVSIAFAHRTFAWESEARGKAHVHVVIIGFKRGNCVKKRIYDYEAASDGPTVAAVRSISPYLVEGGNTVLANRESPLCDVPEVQFGNMPNDDGNLLLTEEERRAIVAGDRRVAKYIRHLLTAKEYLHGIPRWCLWLVNVPPQDLVSIPELRTRVRRVKDYRERSTRPTTRELARYPALFGEIRQPNRPFVLIPRHSSESRRYIPMSFFSSSYIVGDSCLFIPRATSYHFGILTSAMHMAWVRQVCGRLKSDFRYSNKLVYNNYPWPQEATEKQTGRVERCAQAVLDARAKHPGATLADLYDPLAMPANLAKAHAALDKAVDACYRSQPFTSERQRVEYLFALYEKLTTPLTSAPKRRSRKQSS